MCRRKDCLRQLLVVLCERGELRTLVHLPYRDRHVDMEEEVVAILESRARCMDLLSHAYYDVLYAFHVMRGNFRRGLCIATHCVSFPRGSVVMKL